MKKNKPLLERTFCCEIQMDDGEVLVFDDIVSMRKVYICNKKDWYCELTTADDEGVWLFPCCRVRDAFVRQDEAYFTE